MTLNVSRTRVPESWLSTLVAKPSMSYDALDDALALEKSRFSVSTIDTELFPELLSWSTLMNAIPTSPCGQSIPSDITKAGDIGTDTDTDTIFEANSPLSLILDPTAIEVGFDQSCFDGLDDLLIHHPMEAFTEACWLDIAGHPSSSMRATTPTQFLDRPAIRRKLSPPRSPSPEKPVPFADESLKYYKKERNSAIENDLNPRASLRPEPPSYRTDKGLSSIFSDDDATSFILFEAPVLTPNRYDFVGHFPMPSRRPQKNPSSRIATFCSNLPASFTYVR